MANEEQLAILQKGVKAWNEWRRVHSSVGIDLKGADLGKAWLRKADLAGANLSGANLRGADLSDADLGDADLSKANLSGALLSLAYLADANLSGASLSEAHLGGALLCEADLSWADLSEADLSGAYLGWADLSGADLSGANLSGADLYYAGLMGADFTRAELSRADLRCAILDRTKLISADLTGSRVYDISVWNANLEGAIQKDIVLTDDDEPVITVDNLEVAQFIHLWLTNKKIRDVIDIVAKKVVLILGRFSKQRKPVLNAIRERLRDQDYSPVLFDFERPVSRNFAETVRTLAHLSRFIIADLTEAKSIPQELRDIVPKLKIPVLPILRKRAKPWGMWRDIKEYPWIMKVHRYTEIERLLDDLIDTLIPEALDMEKEIARKRLEED